MRPQSLRHCLIMARTQQRERRLFTSLLNLLLATESTLMASAGAKGLKYKLKWLQGAIEKADELDKTQIYSYSDEGKNARVLRDAFAKEFASYEKDDLHRLPATIRQREELFALTKKRGDSTMSQRTRWRDKGKAGEAKREESTSKKSVRKERNLRLPGIRPRTELAFPLSWS
ncbi:hypothetical protein J8273_8445 [Carpediemonas membranifera]|uniref:Uncharacterized protein n=1 Tax=Carpediemonas membranifera TaxID=201153 RepID=A0A8J6DYS8_9EUKA|nr:hypothetical protein J8273_8445 [Carpediemonas membranifera]|eukprot:KAG9389768.1 hypothetical protein J8273_8445 [Carpediemonas membranifera]